jgi:hypothetical protein
MGTTQEPCGQCTGTAWEYQIHPVGDRGAPSGNITGTPWEADRHLFWWYKGVPLPYNQHRRCRQKPSLPKSHLKIPTNSEYLLEVLIIVMPRSVIFPENWKQHFWTIEIFSTKMVGVFDDSEVHSRKKQ